MTTTRLYSIEQIADALRSSEVRGPSRERVFDRLQRMHSYTITESQTSEEAQREIRRYSESDIRAGLNNLFFVKGRHDIVEIHLDKSKGAIDSIIESVREARDTAEHVQRVRVEDLTHEDKGKKVRFIGATIPTWQVMTDFLTIRMADDHEQTYLVLDGRMTPVDDDVTFQIDDRKSDA